jgi:molybdate transport system substrate-binding protein
MVSRIRRLIVCTAIALITGCGSATAQSNPQAAASAHMLTGSLTVLAAASLTEAFNDAEAALEANNPGFTATYSFAGSQQLVMNIIDGAPADVIATADEITMQRLVTAGLVDTPHAFARNRLEIAVAKGNPKGSRTLADLARPDVAVVLADPSVPAGNFARQVLARAGVTITPKSLELDVKTVLEKVESGDADAAIVYATDVAAASNQVTGVVIPDSENIVAVYPIAVVKSTQNPSSARAFVTQAISGAIQAALLRRGFLPP